MLERQISMQTIVKETSRHTDDIQRDTHRHTHRDKQADKSSETQTGSTRTIVREADDRQTIGRQTIVTKTNRCTNDNQRDR